MVKANRSNCWKANSNLDTPISSQALLSKEGSEVSRLRRRFQAESKRAASHGDDDMTPSYRKL